MSTEATVPYKWEATQIQSLEGKVAIVTGANSGIGYVTTLELARKGAHVVMACRSEERGTAAQLEITEELAGTEGAGKVEFMKLDVSNLKSVDAFSKEFLSSHKQLNMLINNAGIMAVPYAETVDGLESQLATSHLGHFALTAKLFDVLKASTPSRVVNLSSLAHRTAFRFNEDELMTPESKYNPWFVYANAKVSTLLFTAELQRRVDEQRITGITAVTAHPGLSETNLMAAPAGNGAWYSKVFWKFNSILPIYQSSEMGALPTLYAATAPGVTGNQYFGPRGLMAIAGHPALEEPSERAKSLSAALKLWEFSEKVTGTAFPIKN